MNSAGRRTHTVRYCHSCGGRSAAATGRESTSRCASSGASPVSTDHACDSGSRLNHRAASSASSASDGYAEQAQPGHAAIRIHVQPDMGRLRRGDVAKRCRVSGCRRVTGSRSNQAAASSSAAAARRCRASATRPGALPLKWLVSSSASRTRPGTARRISTQSLPVVPAARGFPALPHRCRPDRACNRLFGEP